MKQVLSVVLLICVLSLTSYRTDNGKHYFIKTVVIDPGHGGHDSGCLGSSSKEKDIALSISLKLGRFIEENFKNIKVIYTRKTDVFVELHERAAIANNNKADLFICIHCNSGPKGVFGTETYVMGLHRTGSNLDVAKRENAAILMETDYKAKYDGFDPNSPEANIIFTLYQNTFLDQSLALSSHIQTQFKEKLGRYSRGVKQAGFLVLYRTTMPSILIETGFLTHPAEEKYLNSEEGQNSISEAIYKAFKLYKRDIESNGTKGAEEDEGPLKKNIKKTHQAEVKNEEEDVTAKEAPVVVDKDVKKEPAQSASVLDSETQPQKKDSVKDAKKVVALIPANTTKDVVYPKKTIYEKRTQPNESITITEEADNKVVSDTEKPVILFKVKIGSAVSLKILEAPMYKDLPEVKAEKVANGRYILYYGETTSYLEVVDLQTEARKKGFKDAFAVAFNNGKRIPLSDALSLLKKK